MRCQKWKLFILSNDGHAALLGTGANIQRRVGTFLPIFFSFFTSSSKSFLRNTVRKMEQFYLSASICRSASRQEISASRKAFPNINVKTSPCVKCIIKIGSDTSRNNSNSYVIIVEKCPDDKDEAHIESLCSGPC